jgi:carbon-monoxide dehydrogenase large subunit
MQGIGQVLGEHIAYDADSGQLLSGTFMDYFMPKAENLSPITLIDCGVPSPFNPLGAKGAGEAGATGSVPALANAFLDALKPAGVKSSRCRTPRIGCGGRFMRPKPRTQTAKALLPR